MVPRRAVMARLAILTLLLSEGCMPAGTQDLSLEKQRICDRHLESIVEALEAYRAAHGQYPPARTYDAQGTPMHSWRALIMPYTDQGAHFQGYDLREPWDGPHNRLITKHNGFFRSGRLYACPNASLQNDQRFDAENDYGLDLTTNYVMLTYAGKSSYEASRQDLGGPKDRLVIVEVLDSGIHWAEPRDIEAETLEASGKQVLISGKDPDGPCIVALDDGGRGFHLKRLKKGHTAAEP